MCVTYFFLTVDPLPPFLVACRPPDPVVGVKQFILKYECVENIVFFLFCCCCCFCPLCVTVRVAPECPVPYEHTVAVPCFSTLKGPSGSTGRSDTRRQHQHNYKGALLRRPR